MAFIPIIMNTYGDIAYLSDFDGIDDLGFSLTKSLKKVTKKAADVTKKVATVATKTVAPAQKLAVVQQAKVVANKVISDAKVGANKIIAMDKQIINVVADATKQTAKMVSKIAEHANATALAEGYKAMQNLATNKAVAALKTAQTAVGVVKDTAMKTYQAAKASADKIGGMVNGAVNKAQSVAKEVLAHKGAVLDLVKKIPAAAGDVASKIKNSVASAANGMAQKAKEITSALTDKIKAAATAFGDKVMDVKNAVQGELANVKNQLANFAAEGAQKLRDGISSVKEEVAARTKELAGFVQGVVKEQAQAIMDLAKKTEDYFAALRTGQQEIVEFAKQKLLETTHQISQQVQDTAKAISTRFNTIETTLNKANLERNIIRNTVLKKTDEIATMAKANTEKITQTQKVMNEKLDRSEHWSKVNLGLSIASLVAVPILLFIL